MRPLVCASASADVLMCVCTRVCVRAFVCVFYACAVRVCACLYVYCEYVYVHARACVENNMCMHAFVYVRMYVWDVHARV